MPADTMSKPPDLRYGQRATGDLVSAVMRTWRAARDEHGPVQQRLHAMLAPIGCDILAPVFDSLMTLCEAALGRPVRVGRRRLSADEAMLIGLLEGTRSRAACVDCPRATASALDCALCSTRIMLALAR